MIIHCHTGLAGRVTAIANGLACCGRVTFAWQKNAHCPVSHQLIFPHGIPGVTFLDAAPPAMMTRLDDCKTIDVFRAWWNGSLFYKQVLEAMTGVTYSAPHDLAIFARFHRTGTDPDELADLAAHHAKNSGAKSIFLMTDYHRDRVARRMESHGFRVDFPLCQELHHDMDRHPADILNFCADWKQLLASKIIVAPQAPTGILHPAIAAETEIRWTPERKL
jgi:hypothetical protein